MPQQLSFETMAKEFMNICGERYPSSDKVMQRTSRYVPDGASKEEEIMTKIIVLTQFRDGVREVAMDKIFKSLQHRDEVYLAIVEALEDLEDELDELQESEDMDEEEEYEVDEADTSDAMENEEEHDKYDKMKGEEVEEMEEE